MAIKQDLHHSPTDFGYEFVNWTGKSVAFHISKKWGKTLSIRATIDLFHRLHLTLLRPRYQPAKGDAKKQAWFKKALQKFADRLEPEDHLMFLDEASIKWSATISRMWAEIGHQPIIPQIGGHKGVHIIGAVDPRGDRGFFRFTPRLKAPQFIEFIEYLLHEIPTGKIYLVLDNAKVHHAILVQNFLQLHSRLKFLYLPPYSAQLNPIERFWEYLRQQKTHNAFYPKYEEFETTIQTFIEKFTKPQGIIKSVCGYYEQECQMVTAI